MFPIKEKPKVLKGFDPGQIDVLDDFLSDILQAYQEQKKKRKQFSNS